MSARKDIVLDVENLKVDIPVSAGLLHPVRGLTFNVARGETLCIVGESGCGKSLTSLALMGLLPKTARRAADRMDFLGQDIRDLKEREMARLRGVKMAMIFQEPMTSLNPSYTIGNQLEEVYLRHVSSNRAEARERAILLLDKVGISSAGSRLGQYPHQLSGGLRQRVMIAMALMCGPDLIIADERRRPRCDHPGADPPSLGRVAGRFEMAMILITHDLGIVARVADKVQVMYAGRTVEEGPCEAVFDNPLASLYRRLLRCIPVPGKTQPGQRLEHGAGDCAEYGGRSAWMHVPQPLRTGHRNMRNLVRHAYATRRRPCLYLPPLAGRGGPDCGGMT